MFAVTGFIGTTATNVTATGAAAEGITGTVSQELSVQLSRGRSSARKGRHSEAWTRLGYRILKHEIRHDTDCALHATGLVQKCLRAEGCLGLQRMLTTVTDSQGNSISVSVSWVRMPTHRSAWHFLDLIDLDYSGSMTPLADDVSVKARFTGKHYKSRRSGSIVVVADASPVGGQPTKAMLDAASAVAVEFPWSNG